MTAYMAEVERTLSALQQHGFGAQYFADRRQALDWLTGQIPAEATVGIGGSRTIQQLGLYDLLRGRGTTVLWHWKQDLTPEQRRELYHRCMQADVYLCSANALTESGYILNVDGTGNRVATTIFGPGRVYMVAGVNKLVPDVDAALARVEKIAPLNCQRQGKDTPCVASGICSDCESEDRSCRLYVLMKRPPRLTPITVVLIDEELGL